MAKGNRKTDPLAKRQGETNAQWQMRRALAGVVANDDGAKAEPTEFTKMHGDYRKQFVTDVDTGQRVHTTVNRDSTVLQRWAREGGIGFDKGALQAIADCQMFWQRMGCQRITANYGERVAASTHDEGHSAQEAADEIDFRRKMVPGAYWSIFENVVRFNEPAGRAGSSLANNTAQQIAAAKTTVGFVASIMAMRLGY